MISYFMLKGNKNFSFSFTSEVSKRREWHRVGASFALEEKASELCSTEVHPNPFLLHCSGRMRLFLPVLGSSL